MKVLAVQRCIEVNQQIGWTGKQFVETAFDMKLYENKITVKQDCYPLASVFDISYRIKRKGEAIGFLYLHTKSGVRTYYIKEEPTHFIDAYRKLRSERGK